jgi:ATP-dependent RNA helicase DDX54/DBP10
MARTGSGKSLAFLIPLIQRLGGRHSSTFGARALILLPTRELALQILKVGKELARGWRQGEGEHAGDKSGELSESRNRGQGLRWGLVVGGEGLDEQFEMMANNPDMYVIFFPGCATDATNLTHFCFSIIATPGRLLHLVVEMNLDLRSVLYVVFDEADRLFEMGFETALTEIIHRFPTNRQTLLFSATLPKSLVDFAKAGLQNPKLVRLDVDSKISADLRMAFFSVKQDEKDACLLVLLRDIIRVPWGSTESHDQEQGGGGAKGKHDAREQFTAPHQTLVFAATKHHVEYLTTLLTAAGYAVSHIYGSLDQSARTQQMDQFRRGRTNVLVVTDVAARGIDIPVLANVVNYDFPQGARVFVHRVGRTARAGRSGWAWSFVGPTDLPYLIELQLFLGRPLARDAPSDSEASYTESLVLGAFPREALDDEVAYIRALEVEHHALPTLRNVMRKGHGLYERSRGRASPASYVRAKEMLREPARWGLVAAGATACTHPVLRLKGRAAEESLVGEDERRRAMLATVDSFRPIETALEIGSRGKAGNAELMKDRRKALAKAMKRREMVQTSVSGGGAAENETEEYSRETEDVEMANDEDIDVCPHVSCQHRPNQFP